MAVTREQICKQQIHCLSCLLCVMRTGKDCRELTVSEIKFILSFIKGKIRKETL